MSGIDLRHCRARPATEDLAPRAESLFPHSPHLQAEWVRAVLLVRRTSRGWLLDKRAARLSDARKTS